MDIVAFVIGWNAAFGLLFGYLFWRYGLESAMLAHALSHVVSELVTSHDEAQMTTDHRLVSDLSRARRATTRIG